MTEVPRRRASFCGCSLPPVDTRHKELFVPLLHCRAAQPLIPPLSRLLALQFGHEKSSSELRLSVLAQSRQAFPALFGTRSREVQYSHRFYGRIMFANIREHCLLPVGLFATMFGDFLWQPTSAGCALARPRNPEAHRQGRIRSESPPPNGDFGCPAAGRPRGQNTGLGQPPMRCAARSAMARTVACVLPDTLEGITEASATRSPSIPHTRSSVSRTASVSVPIRQVPA
jgi:hypothetical protein